MQLQVRTRTKVMTTTALLGLALLLLDPVLHATMMTLFLVALAIMFYEGSKHYASRRFNYQAV